MRQVLSQTGRPNDGTDATGFYNIEFHVDIYPEKDWESKLTKLQLIDKMQEDLSVYPGIDFNFSQPITDNVEEAASGVKGSIAVKVFGKDLYESEKLAVQIDKILNTVQGIEDLGVIRNIGQPELRIELNERQLARYGVAKEDVQSIIEMAIGGKSASLLYEDERKFNIMVRYSEEFRQNEEEIGKILVPAMDGTMVPIKELADITTITGPLLIFRDNHARFCAVKFSVRGRDMGTAVAEAQKKVNASVHLPAGYSLKWTGDFENQQRASKRLGAGSSYQHCHYFHYSVYSLLQCKRCRTGIAECTVCCRGRYRSPSDNGLQFLYIGGYRFYRFVRYLHTEWRYYDFRYQGKSKTGFALTGGH